MALADRLNNGRNTPMHGKPCSVGELLTKLDGPELEAFKAMLGTPEERGWPASAIWEAVTDEGYEIGLQSINRHRGGRCRCVRNAAAA